uniref:Splicing factor 3B subunit 4 n=1 Tax=Globisporangium ultimum (strain ATCC 200006 / CBS 805.95 / DAOM BR144) TaxID=431595 RepID=K3X596_GLOUD
MSAAIEQRNQDATVYVGNLDDRVTEELLWELMLQAGSVINVHMPRDKVTNTHQNYGFVEFRTEECAEYALKVMNMIQLYGKVMRVKKASQDKKNLDIGANLFIGNLDAEVDEKLLYDTFSAFGGIIETPKIMRDAETKVSRGFGFISFDSFEASDLAIECMNGQYLCNRQVVVQYAYKKDSNNERHGSEAERLLAQSNPNKLKPHTRFAFTTPAAGGVSADAMGGNGALPMAPPPPPMAHLNGGYMAPMGSMGMVPPPPPPPQSMGMYQMGMGGMAPPPPPPMPTGMMAGHSMMPPTAGIPPPPPPPAHYQ